MLFAAAKGSENLCNANAIITAKARPFGHEEFLRTPQFDGVLQRIINRSLFGYTDHIHMSLQYCARRRFAARRCRQIGDDI